MMKQVIAAFSTPQGEQCLVSLGIDAGIIKQLQSDGRSDAVEYSRAVVGALGVVAVVAEVASGDQSALDRFPTENRAMISEAIGRWLAENPQIFESYFATQPERYRSFAANPQQEYRDRIRILSQELKAWAESFAAFPSVLEGAISDLATMADHGHLRRAPAGVSHVGDNRLSGLYQACCNSADYAMTLRELAAVPVEALQLVQPNAVEQLAKAIYNAFGWSVVAWAHLIGIRHDSPKSAKPKHTRALAALAGVGNLLYKTVLRAIDPVGWKAWERELEGEKLSEQGDCVCAEVDDWVYTPEQERRDNEEIDRLQSQIARHWHVAHRAIQSVNFDRKKIQTQKNAAQREIKKIERRLREHTATVPPAFGCGDSGPPTAIVASPIKSECTNSKNMKSSHRYDAFISYRRAEPDRSFARKLFEDLRSAGYTVAMDEVDFLANATFLQEMERCIRASRFTLAVISPRYFESGNCQEEAIIGKVLDMSERRRRIVPLIIEAVEMPVWLYDIVGINFTDAKPIIPPFEKLMRTLGDSCTKPGATTSATS